MTHRHRVRISSMLALGLLLFAFSSDSTAQLRRPATSGLARSSAGGDRILRARDITGLGRSALVRTPQYSTNVRGGVKTPSEWAQIAVEYDTYPEWIDELSFAYYALGLTREDGKKKYSFYKLDVRYVDIEKGRGHTSTVFLHPKAIERYGDLVGVAVEVKHKGQVVHEDSKQASGLPEKWWKNPAVTENAGVTTRVGYLVDRSKSPFALINIDDYEVIR